jgi:hypothetical protein
LSSTVSIDKGDPAAAEVGAFPAAVSGLIGTYTPRPRTRTRWWIEGAVIVWLCWVYDAITNLAPLRLHAALGHATDILRVERSLHLDPEHALDHWLAGHHTLGLILSDYYDNAHFIVTLGLLGWLWWQRADLYRPLRNSLVLVNVLAFVVFWLYPVAPPRMLGGFTDVVASTHAFGSWHTGALASHANQLAAMPSLHMAWAAWCALALWRISNRGWVRALALLYPCMTALAVLATGNHFLLDILGGLVAIAAAIALAETSMRLATRLRSARADRGMSVPRSLPAKSALPAALPAYRVSQTCYEVPNQVD